VPVRRALRAAQRRVVGNGRTSLRAARFVGLYRRPPLDAPRCCRAHSRAQRRIRAPLARHRYLLLCRRAQCSVRLRWTSLSLAGRLISRIRAYGDVRLGVSSGGFNGKEGNVFRVWGHVGQVFIVGGFTFSMPSMMLSRLNTVMDWIGEGN